MDTSVDSHGLHFFPAKDNTQLSLGKAASSSLAKSKVMAACAIVLCTGATVGTLFVQHGITAHKVMADNSNRANCMAVLGAINRSPKNLPYFQNLGYEFGTNTVDGVSSRFVKSFPAAGFRSEASDGEGQHLAYMGYRFTPSTGSRFIVQAPQTWTLPIAH